MKNPTAIVAIAAVFGLSIASGVQAQTDAEALSVQPLEASSAFSATKARRLAPGWRSVFVKLADAPIATYRGGIPGLAATSAAVTGASRLDLSSPQSRAYAAYLHNELDRLEEACQRLIPEARGTHRLPVVFGGMTMVLPEERIADLYQIPEVYAVYPDELLQLDTVRSPQFIGAPRVWRELGGRNRAGEGVIVAAIDSGVWPESPSFSDPDSRGNPYPDPPAKWTGTACEFGSAEPGDAPFACNNKLIGAERFMSTYDALIGIVPTEFPTARDDDGHGTHTLSTAAGNGHTEAAVVFGEPLGEISGVAPRAHAVAYKVCGIEGCFGSDSAAAAQQAILDGVDVINFSITGGTNPYTDAVSLAFLDAYEAGLVVSASAGNTGPGANTVNHREPWTITVAASTHDNVFAGVLVLISPAEVLWMTGISVTGQIFGPIVLAEGINGDDGQCLNPFPAGTFTQNEIVACKRGVIARVEKSQNVAAGGAAGLVLYNVAPEETLNHDKHFLPAIHVDSDRGMELETFLKNNSPTFGFFSQGVPFPVDAFPGGPPILSGGTAGGSDVMAAFSSRGGPGQMLGISKPDVTAPGVQILAGGTPMPNDSGLTASFGAPGDFMVISGTSMSSPHVAGAAALLRDLYPDWTPWQIKSALMTTARRNVLKEDGVTLADPFDYGSGRINLRRAYAPGLTFQSPSKQDFLDHQLNLWSLNYPSLYMPVNPGRITVQRTVQNETHRGRRWDTSVSSPNDLHVSVPEGVTIPKHGARTFDITVDARDVPMGEVRHANLRLDADGYRANFPITIVKNDGGVPLTKTCDPTTFRRGQTTECTITMTNTTFNDVAVSLRDRLPPELRLERLVEGADRLSSRLFSFNGILDAAEPPDITVEPGMSPFGYFSLAGLGVPPEQDVGDETLINLSGFGSFVYAGETYSRIGLVSNGYAVVGGGTGADIAFAPQMMPNPAAPNNVLAPFWTDLDGSAGGNFYAAILTAGPRQFLVLEWEDVPEFSSPDAYTFQIWIELGISTQAIWMVYDRVDGDGDDNVGVAVGAENKFGNRGATVASLPDASTELAVGTAPPEPGGMHTVRFTAKGVREGTWENCAEMASSAFFGTALACSDGRVRPK